MCRSYSHIWYGIEPHFTIPCSLRTSLSRFSRIFYWRCWIVSMWAGQHSFLWWSHSNNTQALTVSRPPALPRKTWICFRIKKQLVPLDILQIQMAQIHPNPFRSPKFTNKLQQQQEHDLEKPTIYIYTVQWWQKSWLNDFYHQQAAKRWCLGQMKVGQQTKRQSLNVFINAGTSTTFLGRRFIVSRCYGFLLGLFGHASQES